MFDNFMQSLNDNLLIFKIGQPVYNIIKKHNGIIKIDCFKNFTQSMMANQLVELQNETQEANRKISKMFDNTNTMQKNTEELNKTKLNPKGNCAGLALELINNFAHKKIDSEVIDLFHKNLESLNVDFAKRIASFQNNQLKPDLLAKTKLVATEWQSYYTNKLKINMSDFANNEFLFIFIHMGDFKHALCAGPCKLIKNYQQPQLFFFYDPNLPTIITFENKKDCENFMEDYFKFLKKQLEDFDKKQLLDFLNIGFNKKSLRNFVHGIFYKKRLLDPLLRQLDNNLLSFKHNACICVTSITSFNKLNELRKLIQSISVSIRDKSNYKTIISICNDILKSEFGLKRVEVIRHNSIFTSKHYCCLSKSIASLLTQIDKCKEFTKLNKKEYITNIYQHYIKHRPLFLEKYQKIIPILKNAEIQTQSRQAFIIDI